MHSFTTPVGVGQQGPAAQSSALWQTTAPSLQLAAPGGAQVIRMPPQQRPDSQSSGPSQSKDLSQPSSRPSATQ